MRSPGPEEKGAAGTAWDGLGNSLQPLFPVPCAPGEEQGGKTGNKVEPSKK